MATVFFAWHEYDNEGCDDAKLFGVFSSRARAEGAINARRNKPGFIDHPEGFQISEYVLDEDREWIDGFVKVREM